MLIAVSDAIADWLVQIFRDAGLRLVRSSADKRALRKAVDLAVESVLAQANPATRKALKEELRRCFVASRQMRELTSAAGESLNAAIDAQLEASAGPAGAVRGQPLASGNWASAELSRALLRVLSWYAAARDLPELAVSLVSGQQHAQADPTDGVPAQAVANRAGVHNIIEGKAGGQVVQAGAVHGDVTIYGAVESLAAATQTLPGDIASFTGRGVESERLLRAVLGSAPVGGVVEITAIDGMAGVGKTAFAVHVAHQLAPRFPDGQLFLRLYGHIPGHRPVEPTDALSTLLLTVGVTLSRSRRE